MLRTAPRAHWIPRILNAPLVVVAEILVSVLVVGPASSPMFEVATSAIADGETGGEGLADEVIRKPCSS